VVFVSLSELYAYRVLLYSLVVRDLKARYRGSTLGFFWTLLNPLLLMLTYTLVFSVYMRVEMTHYAAFLLTGLLPWLWFSSSLNMGAVSLVEGGGLLKKVFFPPQILPAVSVLSNFVNYLLSLPLLLGLLVVIGLPLGWAAFAIVPVATVQLVLTYGLALAVAALTVRYRDLAQLLGNLLMLWFFLSPIIYPATLVPRQFIALLALNPMAPLLVAYQNAIFWNTTPAWGSVAVVAIVAVAVLLGGVALFERFRWTLVEQV
jgi:ABC-type polysaccharide/polyol phosphate export permease